jgi:uncharacterized membrane protein YgcG
MRRILLLAFAVFAFAADPDLPKSAGYVNDFAGKLPAADRQALETRLRDYERATSNEVAIAVVESLHGQTVEVYANRLFKAWGVGKKDRNNGVLLLWAPAERKVRIEVGMGLEAAIPNSAAADILRNVTALFRQDEYVRGLSAGVDGIMARLGSENGANAPQSAAPVPVPEQAEESQPDSRSLLIPAIGVAALVGFAVMLWRRARLRKMAESLPKDLDRAVAAVGELEAIRKNAVAALDDLRREAPPEVWEAFPALVTSAASELSRFREELAAIRAMPRQEFGDLNRVHDALKRWNNRFSDLWERLNAVYSRLDSFRYCREHSQLMLSELRESLERRNSDGWGTPAKLVRAAGETYAQAVAAMALNPVNWLLVYDLLTDTRDCLLCAEDPERYWGRQRSRNWMASEDMSPALELMMMQPTWNRGSASVQSSSMFDSGSGSGGDSGGGSGGDSGGGFGGDSGGSFGGGDSGGGGSSSDY